MSNQPVQGDFRIKDGVVEVFYQGEWKSYDLRSPYEQGRADMLEQVIEYLEDDLVNLLWYGHFTVRTYMDRFKKAMRPQEDNQ